jgi:hypothetical protein
VADTYIKFLFQQTAKKSLLELFQKNLFSTSDGKIHTELARLFEIFPINEDLIEKSIQSKNEESIVVLNQLVSDFLHIIEVICTPAQKKLICTRARNNRIVLLAVLEMRSSFKDFANRVVSGYSYQEMMKGDHCEKLRALCWLVEQDDTVLNFFELISLFNETKTEKNREEFQRSTNEKNKAFKSKFKTFNEIGECTETFHILIS